ncbi:MAG: vitamin K epoxide reductase family protein [Acidobacteriota bacterium]
MLTGALKERTRYGLAMLCSLVGLGDALYLTVQHLTGQSVRCAIVTGCSAVLSSRYSTFGGLPTAIYGVGAYFLAFSLATLALFGSVMAIHLLRLTVTGMFVGTLGLLYLQAFVIKAFCTWCLVSAAMTTLLVILTLLLRRPHR